MRQLAIFFLIVIRMNAYAQDSIDMKNTHIDKQKEIIQSKAAKVYDGIFHINVINTSNVRVNIFVNNIFVFALMADNGNGDTRNNIRVALRGESVLYAKTENNKFQWGPIKLNEEMDNFVWNLEYPK